MEPGVYQTWRKLPDDPASAVWITLNRIAELARTPSPRMQRVAYTLVERSGSASEFDQAETIFDWTRRVIHYRYDPPTIEDIKTPDYLLHLIERDGVATEDCDGYVGFLGAAYTALGFPVMLEVVGLHADEEWEHIYLKVSVDGEWVAADAIVEEPFGWEIPEEEVTSRIEMPV